MQMLAAPVKDDLEDRMQVRQGRVTADEESAPEQRTHLTQDDTQLIDAGRFRWLVHMGERSAMRGVAQDIPPEFSTLPETAGVATVSHARVPSVSIVSHAPGASVSVVSHGRERRRVPAGAP